MISHAILRRIAIGTALACCFAAGFLVGRPGCIREKVPTTPQALANLPDRATPLNPGLWGNLEAVPIRIEPPEEYLPIKGLEENGRQWKFAGYTTDSLAALFISTELTSDQRMELMDASRWQLNDGEIVVTPSSDLIATLSQAARKKIYTALWQIPESGLRSRMASFRADQFDEIFAQSGLRREIVDDVRRMSFRHGQLIFFCDAPWVLGTISDFNEKVRFVKTIVGKSTLLVRLHVMPDSNVNSLANYWSKAASGKDIKPMLESLARVPGGARVSLVHLLPTMPTASLYTFSFPSLNPTDQLKDCHWVALNFFRDPPDLGLTDHGKIKKIFQDDYYPVLSDPRYGDLVQIVRANGDIIHTAVFIADDVVFTKNSADAVEPFMLMRFQTLIDTFSAFVPENETLRLVILRNKYY